MRPVSVANSRCSVGPAVIWFSDWVFETRACVSGLHECIREYARVRPTRDELLDCDFFESLREAQVLKNSNTKRPHGALSYPDGSRHHRPDGPQTGDALAPSLKFGAPEAGVFGGSEQDSARTRALVSPEALFPGRPGRRRGGFWRSRGARVFAGCREAPSRTG